jgi:hypothetical protein
VVTLAHKIGDDVANSRHVDKRFFAFFAGQIFAVVFLQRIAVPGLGIAVGAALMPACLLWLLSKSGLGLSLTRTALYSSTLFLIVVDQSIITRTVSTASIALLAVCYLPLLVEYPVSRQTYFRCLSFFQNVILFVCAIVVIEDIWQLMIGWQSFPDMNKFLPKSWIVQGFVYLQPLKYGSPYAKPNAFFFKEVSYLSQFLAIAFVVELTSFRRYWRLALYLGCIFASFAGTGLLLLVIVSPILALRMNARYLFVFIAMAIVVAGIAVATGWYDQISDRFAEFGKVDASAYGRFVYPLIMIGKLARDGIAFFTGLGAGNIPTTQLFVFIPPVKVLLEYGAVVTFTFYIMLGYALFSRTPNLSLAITLFVLFNAMGGYFQDPAIIDLMVLLGTLMRWPITKKRSDSFGFSPLQVS